MENQDKGKSISLDSIALVYGASGVNKRDKLLNSLDKSIGDNNPLIADAFLDKFNSNSSDELISNSFKELISIQKNKKLQESIVKLENLSKVDDNYSEQEKKLGFNMVNENSNKEILLKLLDSKEVNIILNKMDKLIFKYEKLNILEQNSKKGQNIKSELKNLRELFFSEKTKVIMQEVLTRGGQIYFTLDGIATSIDKNGKVYLDEYKLKSLLTKKNDKNYSSITAKELRVLVKEFLNHPNLKIVVENQLIDHSILKNIKNKRL